MAATTFETGTLIASEWLNEVDQVVHDSDGANYVNYTPTGSNASVRSVQAKIRDTVSVKDFGATGDGSTDDTVAIQAAHDSFGALGGNLYFPKGIYKISSINISTPCTLQGSGAFSGGTWIVAADATSNVFNITTSSVSVIDMLFSQNVTRSAGAYIYFNTASSIGRVENVYMLGCFQGIRIAGVSNFTLRNILISTGVASTGIGILIESGLLIDMSRVVVVNQTGSEMAAGCKVTACGDIVMEKCSFIECVNGLTLVPGVSSVVTSVYASDCFFDNCTENAVKISPTSTTGTVHRVRFTSCWFASSVSGSGVLLDTTAVAGTIDGITFIDPEVYLNGSHGIWITGPNTKRIKILGGKIAQNTGSGILIQDSSSNLQIIGVTSGEIGSLTGNTTYGISNSSGVTDDLLVMGNQLTGNTTSSYQAGATGVRRILENNNGYNPSTLLLVPNIPIGGVAYSSLGTSAVHVAGTIYVSEILLPGKKTVTGIGILNGATAATDSVIVGIYGADGGAVLANSSLSGTVATGANIFQTISLTSPIELQPGRYFIAFQANGTTTTTRRIAANTYLNAAKSTVGSFGTLGSLTVPTSTTADAGPIGYFY